MAAIKFDGLKSGMVGVTKLGDKILFLEFDGKLVAYYENDGKFESFSGVDYAFTRLDPVVKVYSGASNDPYNFVCISGGNESSLGKQVWPEPKVELTLQEIADKFGISVHDLRIKEEVLF